MNYSVYIMVCIRATTWCLLYLESGSWEKLSHPTKRTQGDSIGDIYDGSKWKEMEKRGWFKTAQDIGLILSTDGGALFKSSKVEAWPVWGVVANLPPSERYLFL